MAQRHKALPPPIEVPETMRRLCPDELELACLMAERNELVKGHRRYRDCYLPNPLTWANLRLCGEWVAVGNLVGPEFHVAFYISPKRGALDARRIYRAHEPETVIADIRRLRATHQAHAAIPAWTLAAAQAIHDRNWPLNEGRYHEVALPKTLTAENLWVNPAGGGWLVGATEWPSGARRPVAFRVKPSAKRRLENGDFDPGR